MILNLLTHHSCNSCRIRRTVFHSNCRGGHQLYSTRRPADCCWQNGAVLLPFSLLRVMNCLPPEPEAKRHTPCHDCRVDHVGERRCIDQYVIKRLLQNRKHLRKTLIAQELCRIRRKQPGWKQEKVLSVRRADHVPDVLPVPTGNGSVP